jgi:hypothetical protein
MFGGPPAEDGAVSASNNSPAVVAVLTTGLARHVAGFSYRESNTRTHGRPGPCVCWPCVVAVADAGGSLIALDGADLYPLLASIALAAPIASGDRQYGAFVALNGSARHGERGVSRSGRIAALAGLDSAVTYEQLDDCRSRNAMPRNNCCIATIAGCTKRTRAVTTEDHARRRAPNGWRRVGT